MLIFNSTKVGYKLKGAFCQFFLSLISKGIFDFKGRAGKKVILMVKGEDIMENERRKCKFLEFRFLAAALSQSAVTPKKNTEYTARRLFWL